MRWRSLTANLISRFLLNLQSVNQKVTGEDSRTTHGGSVDQTESLVFQRVVGSIASSTSVDVGLTRTRSLGGYGDGGEVESGDALGDTGRRASEYELPERSAMPDLDSDSVKDVRGNEVEEVVEVQRLPLTLR